MDTKIFSETHSPPQTPKKNSLGAYSPAAYSVSPLSKKRKVLKTAEFGSIRYKYSSKGALRSIVPPQRARAQQGSASASVSAGATGGSSEDGSAGASAEDAALQEQFSWLSDEYKMVRKVGSGAFSNVYQAQDVRHGQSHDQSHGEQQFVAIKCIFATCSPARVRQELEFLHSLSTCKNIVPVLDTLRHEDQVLIVMPYCEHVDFRDFFRDLPITGIKVYMRELFLALQFVSDHGVIHRDVKPNNFLFDPRRGRGVLVDFGLAESVVGKKPSCACCQPQDQILDFKDQMEVFGCRRDDERPARRANRAGTRGFRAPEVLFRCQNQTPKVDVWAAGVILLCLISRRYPFFESREDVDAVIELSTIYGVQMMQETAALHGLGFETNLGTLKNRPRTFGTIIHWALTAEAKFGSMPKDSVAFDTLLCLSSDGSVDGTFMGREHKKLLHLLKWCLALDHRSRFSAADALGHPFFQ